MPRTRSAGAHRKVLRAALELVAEHGIDGTSMDAVARQSGVSKATIYKHWADKEALLLEMLAEATGLHTRPTFDSGDLRGDLIAVLSYRPQEDAAVRERILPHVLAYSAHNRTFGAAWRKMIMDPAMRELRRLIGQAIRKRELELKLDVELALGLLLGPVLYWQIFPKDADPPLDSRSLATAVVDAFLKAWRKPKAAPATAPGKPRRRIGSRRKS